MEPFELPVDDLLLRPWGEDDAPAVWAALQDPDTRLWNAGSDTLEGARALIARRSDWSTGDHGCAGPSGTATV